MGKDNGSFLFEAARYIDGRVMDVVGAGVKAYNWTFGGNKLDLAKNLNRLSIGAIALNPFFSICSFNLKVFSSLSCGLIWGATSMYGNNFLEKHLYRKEQEALRKKCLDSDAETIKKVVCPIAGYGVPLFFYSGIPMNTPGGQEGMILLGGGLFSASWQVMRADDYPRQKNVFSRTGDKIKAGLEDVLKTPQPVYVPVRLSELSEEDCRIDSVF